MADIQLYMILGVTGIFVLVIGAILWNQIRQTRKKSNLEDTSAHGSPSSFDSESKTKMLFRMDKRETQLRRERILEGGTLPELTELVIYSPVKGEKIDTPEVDIRGKTAVRSIVWINCQAAFVDVDGSFIGSVPLTRGKNNLDIVVIGPYGRSIYTAVDVNCSSKEAPNLPAGTSMLLPQMSLDIRADTRPETYSPDSEMISEDGAPSMKYTTAAGDPMVVSESEIDPSVLAALKGDPISDASIDIPDIPDLGAIEAEEMEIPDIPDIPDVLGDDSVEDVQIPDIPDVPDEAEEEQPEEKVVSDDKEAIEESVKIIEETLQTEQEALEDDGVFPPDKMLPKQPGDDKKIEADEAIELSEFQPLHQEIVGLQELTVKTTHQILKDERSTEILKYSGIITRGDGEVVKILKIEKRIEKIGDKWCSTVGVANLTDTDLSLVEFTEFISNTFKIKDMLPVNVLEPIVDTIPEGVKITWTMNDIKPQMKLFITYTEEVNPLEVISEDQRTPKIVIKK